ncbi:tetrapyrrole biosynthesis, uroporphyrinogen III synthase [Pluteus cervinus]|uniref:Tetrapyrrole biosynthesis, uroporphyrinogen III synthase n=1 Tax=Pluteus cervinus TaxID=181527 RepID=A0ACD3AAS3_9AGAR|nr:tetrapyrrole biosynthesis, uroporphyrinogen III synthase [Pluteus cervinus]
MTIVLLLRSPDPPSDHYESIFAATNTYTPISLNPLETVFTNLDTLQDVLKAGPSNSKAGKHKLDGVIITSGRACKAWENAVQDLDILESNSSPSGGTWSTIPFYVVGQSTASHLRSLHQTHPNSPFTPSPDLIRGETTGSGEQLARFIVDDLKERSPARLLYLVGDKNRDTIPTLLSEAGIELEQIQVYGTQASSTFGEELDDVVRARSVEGTPPWWIVYFAPSSADFTTPFLQKHFSLAETPSQDPPPLSTDPLPLRASIAAIGRTTSTHLREVLGLRVDAVAEKPSPDRLLTCIQAFDRDEELL